VSHPIIHIDEVRIYAATGPRLLPRPKDKYETMRGQEKEEPPKEGNIHNPQRHRMRHRQTLMSTLKFFTINTEKSQAQSVNPLV